MRTIGRLLLSAIFLVLTALLVLAAKYAPALVFSFYPELSRKALGVISAVTRAVPLAVWELLAGLAILWLLYTFVRIFTQHRSFLCWLAGIVLGVCVGLFVFVALWGLNHFGPSVGEQLGLSVREYTKQELQKATEYYAAQVNRLSGLVPRDADSLAHLDDFETLSKQAGAGYDKLAQRYALFTGSHDPVKKLATWRMFSQFGITGIFFCLLHGRGVRKPGHIRGLAAVYDVPRAGAPADGRCRGWGKLLRVSGVHGKRKPGISVFRRHCRLRLLPQRAL